MKMIAKRITLLLACLPSSFVFALGTDVPHISPSQSIYLNQQIEKQLVVPDQRDIVKEWSVEKQIAEFICKPAALNEVRKTAAAAEKVIFLDDTDRAPQLLPNGVLIGVVQYREGVSWHKMEYTCRLQENGHLRSFTVKPVPKTLA